MAKQIPNEFVKPTFGIYFGPLSISCPPSAQTSTMGLATPSPLLILKMPWMITKRNTKVNNTLLKRLSEVNFLLCACETNVVGRKTNQMSHAKPDKAFRCPQYTNSVLVLQSSAPPRDWVSAAAAANQNTQVMNKLKQHRWVRWWVTREKNLRHTTQSEKQGQSSNFQPWRWRALYTQNRREPSR